MYHNNLANKHWNNKYIAFLLVYGLVVHVYSVRISETFMRLNLCMHITNLLKRCQFECLTLCYASRVFPALSYGAHTPYARMKCISESLKTLTMNVA